MKNISIAFVSLLCFASFTVACSTTKVSERSGWRGPTSDYRLQIDHIIYAAPNLDNLSNEVADKTGVEPVVGGRHLNLGTHNALLSLASATYLELISPDPQRSPKIKVTTFGIGKIKQPTIVGWAISSPNLAELREHLIKSGFTATEIMNGIRERPDGLILRWKTFFITNPELNEVPSLLPFFIEWESAHPATTSPRAGDIVSWSARHPHPEKFEKLFEALQMDMPVTKNEKISLELVLHTPQGEFKIR